jgi:hypothetical protein
MRQLAAPERCQGTCGCAASQPVTRVRVCLRLQHWLAALGAGRWLGGLSKDVMKKHKQGWWVENSF